EQRAVEAGEIDAIIDHSTSNVILFPAARRALRELARRADLENRESVANTLLAALPPMEYRHLLAGCEAVTLRFGDVLYEAGDTIRHVYFPIDCAVSLLTVDCDHVLGAALVGYEGMLGIPLALGVGVSSVRARVQG